MLLLLGACGAAPDAVDPLAGLEDAWVATMHACAPPRPFLRDADVPAPLSEACVAALGEDLGLDPADFAEAPEAYAQLLEGAYTLLGREMGAIDDLAVGDEVQAPLVALVTDVGARVCATEVSQAVYDFVMWQVRTTRPLVDDPEGAALLSYDVSEHTLYAGALPLGVEMTYAAALVHEAAHGWYEAPHVPCPGTGLVVCDEGWASSVGLEAGVARVIADHVSDADPWGERWRRDARDAAAAAAAKVIE